jgi:hypothetical protein
MTGFITVEQMAGHLRDLTTINDEVRASVSNFVTLPPGCGADCPPLGLPETCVERGVSAASFARLGVGGWGWWPRQKRRSVFRG